MTGVRTWSKLKVSLIIAAALPLAVGGGLASAGALTDAPTAPVAQHATCDPSPVITTNPDGSEGFSPNCVIPARPTPQASTVTVTATPTASPTPTDSSSSPVVSTPPDSSLPPATSTSPTPTPTPTSPSTITNGQQINSSNTGYLAWVGPNGERCTDATLKVYTAKVNASTLGSSATCVWLKQGINIDAPITLTAARVDAQIRTNPNNKTSHVMLNWSTVNPPTVQDWDIGPSDFDVFRSQLTGSSDGVRFEKTNLVEDFIQVKAANNLDHNDGVQAYQASSGGSILRSNIDGLPVNGSDNSIRISYGNSAIFFADGSKGTVEIRDNYLQHGGDTMRLNESMSYRVTGNIILKWPTWPKDDFPAPLTTTNSIAGAFLEWSNNTLSDGAPLNR